jgi:NTP pyrophosphatase (non-canonical NTP hydrolase)
MTIDLEKSYKDIWYQTNCGDLVKIERDKGDSWRGEISNDDEQVMRLLYNRDGTTIDKEKFRYNINSEKFIEKNKSIQKPLFPSMNLPRPVILWMAGQMEHKLALNDYKGTWDHYGPEWLFERLLKEMAELFNAMIRYQNQNDYKAIIEECADCCNFSLMIADVINKKFNKGKNEENNTRPANT